MCVWLHEVVNVCGYECVRVLAINGLCERMFFCVGECAKGASQG